MSAAKRTPLSGPEMVALSKRHTMTEWSAQAAANPIPIAHAKGSWFWTPEEEKFLDFNSQLMCTNIGHGDERVLKAITDQAALLAYANPFMATEPRARLGQKLAEICPGDIDAFFFTNGGAEAVENAFRIARLYTGRHKIAARYRSYHGGTSGALSATGDPRRWFAEPGMPGIFRIPDFQDYGAAEPRPVAEVLAETEKIIGFEGPQNVAAIIVEPVVGTNGILIPPDGYMQGLRDICDRHGILLIADEVMAGFGRTGKWFAIDHSGVVPDMITMAKGLTNGAVPMGAVAASDQVYNAFMQGPEGAIELFHGYTYSAHPVACAAGIATQEIYRKEGLFTRASDMAPYWADGVHSLKGLPHVIDLRNLGLIGAVELDPIPGKPGLRGYNTFVRAFEQGLLLRVTGDIIAMSPPLIIEKQHIDQVFGILGGVLKEPG